MNLIYARERLRETNAVDIESVGDELCMEDVGAVNKDTKCYRCGGYGHVAMNWATPTGDGQVSKCSGQKKGRGRDNGQEKGAQGDGKGFGCKVAGKDGRPTCSCCGKVGHGPHKCWTKHLEHLPWKRISATEWVCLEEKHDIGGIEKMGMDVPPRLELRNRYQVLADADDLDSKVEVPIGTLDIEEVEECEVQAVTGQKARKLVFARMGKITIDAGAAVMPKDMLVNEPTVKGQAKRTRVKYVAANGARMETQAEKRVRFKRSGREVLNSITFQVTDVAKPLAAVSKILDKGNTVVFSRESAGSCIDQGGDWGPL